MSRSLVDNKIAGLAASRQAKAQDAVAEILDQRGKTHGPWVDQAGCAQSFKELARSYPGWERLLPSERETLDMLFVKMSRILSGEPHHQDHWDDLAGYSRLTAEALRRDASHARS